MSFFSSLHVIAIKDLLHRCRAIKIRPHEKRFKYVFLTHSEECIKFMSSS